MLKYTELFECLRSDIEAGRLKSGERLPSIRSLVQARPYSKNTVLKALGELEAGGYIEPKARQGYFVCFNLKTGKEKLVEPGQLEAAEVSLPSIFHTIMAKGAAFDLTPGAEDKLIPSQLIELNRALGRAQKRAVGDKAMYYDAPAGDLILKQQLRARYKLRDLHLDENDICITSGCQNALFLALSVSCRPGDTVAVESPCFYGVLQLLEQLRLHIVEIPSSPKTGMELSQLALALQKFRIEACVVTPNFSTPTGALMPDDNKRTLIKLANEHSLTLIEDDIYGELSFGQEVKSLAGFDTQDRVILCSSFSKTLSRDLRVGWVISRRWHEALVRLKLSTQLASSKSSQQAIADFIRGGYYRRHLLQFKRSLIVQRNQLLAALEEYWPNSLAYHIPQGGLALWLELPEQVDTNELYVKFLQQGIILTPGSLFSSQDRFRHCLRVSFNQPVVGERLAALKKLGQFFQ